VAGAEAERWVFERVDPNISGASGKITDLFRNEGLDERGHLIASPPGLAATLMSREVIQNSWDAARELRDEWKDMPSFAIDFHFRDASGAEKDRLVFALGLAQLSAHAAAVAPTTEERETRLGLGSGDCLVNLKTREVVSYCEIVEHGATGMYGPWQGTDSRMYLAMLAIGHNQKADGSGGTFGYGKAGLIRASLPRIVIAYTCFQPRADDPGVTRRLLGVTYWGSHKDSEGHSLNGFARFGRRTDAGMVVPFENEAADAVASSLGFGTRNPAKPEELGTTFLIVDPSVVPEDLKEAIERNWWPALLDHRFNVTITGQDGRHLHCRPRSNPRLQAFVEAHDFLESGSQPGDGHIAKRWDLGRYTPQGGESLALGHVALIAEPAGWSFPDETGNGDGTVQSRSLVALTRDPRMVVEYHLPGRDIARRVPFVRGLFVAGPEVNALLAKTEPKAHDKWDAHESDDVPTIATKFAARILEEIKSRVKDFQEELRPPVDESGAVRLQRLDDKLKRLRNRDGDNPPPPPPGERPFSIGLDVAREPDGGDLRLRGSFHVALALGAPVDELLARIRVSLALDEDGRRGDSVTVAIHPPQGFQPVPDDPSRFDGLITRKPVRFEILSDAYRADWTGDLLVSAEPLANGGAEQQ
jgi:hypothetical protein